MLNLNCQVCYINKKFLFINDLNLFDFVIIKFDSKQCICQIVLKNTIDQINKILISNIVCNSIIEPKNTKFFLIESSITEIIKLKSLQQFEEVFVHIFVDDISDKIQTENCKNFANYCRILLNNYCVGHDFYINIGFNKSTCFLKFCNLLIQLPSTQQNEYGFITSKTKIFIRRISCINSINDNLIYFHQFSSLVEKLSSLMSQVHSNFFNPSIILWGPPSCGKSTLVKLCSELRDLPYVTIDPVIIFKSENVANNLISLSEKIDKVIEFSRTGTRIVLFFKNLENFIEKNEFMKEMINSLINCNIECSNNNLIIVASTNNLSSIDIKFNHQIMVGYPDMEDRKFILSNICKLNHFNSDKLYNIPETLIKKITLKSSGYSILDLLNFHQNASFLSFLENNKLDYNKIEMLLYNEGNDVKCNFFSEVEERFSWEKLVGCDDAKNELMEAIVFPLQYSQIFKNNGLSLDTGVLLHGPPGCGKTMMVRLLASHVGVNFISLSAAQLYSPYLGDSEKKLNEIFMEARNCAPCIIFIDELDSIVGSRNMSHSASNDVHQRVLTTLLTEIDGIGNKLHQQTWNDKSLSEACIILVAASNRPELIDTSLRRRFNHSIYVGPPDQKSRLSILHKYTEKMVNIDQQHLSEITTNFSGADLENLCKKAFMIALDNCQDVNNIIVTNDHFKSAYASTKPSSY